MDYPKLIKVIPTEDFSLELFYDNNEIRYYDFSENFSHPFYKPLSNIDLFRLVEVKDGFIEWKTGQDFCPYTLFDGSQLTIHNSQFTILS